MSTSTLSNPTEWSFPPEFPSRQEESDSDFGTNKDKEKKGGNLFKIPKDFKFGGYIEVNEKWLTKLVNFPYRKVRSFFQNAQITFALLVLLSGLVVPEIRNFFLMRAWKGKVVFALLEFSSWAFLTYILGRNRLPVNYISLVIMRACLSLELQYEFELEARKTKVRKGHTSTNGSGDVGSVSWGPLRQNLMLMSFFLLLGYLVTKYSRINIGKLDNLALFGCFVTCVGGTGIFVSALAINRIGTELHRTMCMTWASLALIMTFWLALFLLQRLMLHSNRHLSHGHASRMVLEVLICLVQVYLVLRYIPVIHPGFNLRDSVPFLTLKTLEGMLPQPIQEFVDHTFFIICTILRNYYLTFPSEIFGYIEE